MPQCQHSIDPTSTLETRTVLMERNNAKLQRTMQEEGALLNVQADAMEAIQNSKTLFVDVTSAVNSKCVLFT